MHQYLQYLGKESVSKNSAPNGNLKLEVSDFKMA